MYMTDCVFVLIHHAIASAAFPIRLACWQNLDGSHQTYFTAIRYKQFRSVIIDRTSGYLSLSLMALRIGTNLARTITRALRMMTKYNICCSSQAQAPVGYLG